MDNARGFALFDTALGRCGIAWGPRGITGIHLPEEAGGDPGPAAARIGAEADGAAGPREATPPPAVRRAMEAIGALLRGEAADLSTVALDLEGLPPFQRRVYEAARAIPPATTVSYGELAARCGAPGAARAVGRALGRNPFPLVVPCHRVVAAGGRLGGFSAPGGTATKGRLLAIEGAILPGAAPVGGGPGPATGSLAFDAGRALRHLRRADPDLARLMDAVGPLRLAVRPTPSLFAALARAIVHQQLAGSAAAAIFGRLCAACGSGEDGPTAEAVLRCPDQRLRAAGLSSGKCLALRDLAARAAAGELPSLEEARGLDDEAIVQRLVRVRGVGRWTAEMVLIFHLGRPDVLPLDDYGIRKGFAAAFATGSLPDRREVEARGLRWKPYRSAASWYLWRAAERPPA